MMLTIISHFYNEEFLLPFWIRHHLRLFDYAILIDYASTDHSTEIIREMAPHWEVRPSQSEWFSAEALDHEVMAIEREVEGWKIALNTTEMLFHYDLKAYLARFEAEHPGGTCVSFSSIVMVDDPADRFRTISSDQDLFLQKQYGYYDRDQAVRRWRLLHREPDGAYHIGRHGTRHPTANDFDVPILWWGWSPIEYVRDRKLQIQTRIPPSDRYRGWGKEHLLTLEQLEATYQQQALRAYDLKDEPLFSDSLEPICAHYNLKED